MALLHDGITIFKREMLIFKSNLKTNIIRSMMFPLIILLFFGNLGSGIVNVPIAVANYANNPSSAQFINDLELSQALTVTATTNQETGMSMLHSGSIDMLIVILPSFPKTAGGEPSLYAYYSSSQFSEVGAAIPAVESIAAKFGTHLANTQQTTIATVSTSGTSSSYRDFLIAGVILMATAFGGVFGSGMSMITDRQLGNIKSFLITPINKDAIVLGKLLSGTVQSSLYGLIALGLGFLLGGSIAMGMVGLLWILPMILLVAMAFSGIAIMLGSRIKTVEVYAIISQTIVMPLWFLSGAFFPASSFPPLLQPFSVADPLTYATVGIRDIMLNGFISTGDILLDFGVLAAFTIAGLIIGFGMFKSTIE